MNNKYDAFKAALKDDELPCLVLDLDAFDANIQWALKASHNKKIRLATKSLRSPAIFRRILASSPQFQGLMCFDLEEALWLRSQGLTDLLLGYPSLRPEALKKLAQDPSEIVLMVDSLEHLEYLAQQMPHIEPPVEICVDIDLSMDLPGLRFGVYRSPIQTLSQLEAFLVGLKKYPQFKLVGLMGYEAQIAGVGDKGLIHIQLLKKISRAQLFQRRQKMYQLVQNYGHELRFVNGGGTGSLDSTTQESWVSEVTVGSAFYAPTLFDHYQDFSLSPALYFARPVVRRPALDIYTCFGGGQVSSGPAGEERVPLPSLPLQCNLLKHEAAGEVQTPVYCPHPLKLGDPIFFRHAKAGEICEHYQKIKLVRGDKKIEEVKTYRGENQCFI
jgi:D-serine deaminase-like pyridoxal phosphate-dependent protein